MNALIAYLIHGNALWVGLTIYGMAVVCLIPVYVPIFDAWADR